MGHSSWDFLFGDTLKSSHQKFINRALSLARKGNGLVGSNPYVGCVIVNKGKIVGEGFHAYFGGPHAEVVALKKAGHRAKGGTMYVTLEPCTFWGKTPPCTPLVVASGIKQVVVSMKDPNPRVSGRGISSLKRHGLRVQVGLGCQLAENLNKAFITYMKHKRPYIILKMAMSLDGKIATFKGESKWISSPESRKKVHQLRGESGAVLVGAKTAQRDNPQLTSHGHGKNPLRIILDPKLTTSSHLKIYKNPSIPTVVVTGVRSRNNKLKLLQNQGIQILRISLKYGKFELTNIVKYLHKINVNQLLIEGGGETAWAFIKNKLVDEAWIFIAPLILGGRDSKSPVEGQGFAKISKALNLKSMTATPVGPDMLIKARFN